METKILISDFDGTMTRFDFFDLVRRRWPVPPAEDPWEKYTAGRITHFEALAEIFIGIRSSEAYLLELVETMELDPDLARSVGALQEHGWEVAVASAGCDWYIRRLLGNAGVSVPVHANPGTFSEEGGLRMVLPEGSRFLSPSTGVDKLAIVRDALDRADEVAFAGDGRPDLGPALLVPAARRFARGWLAEALADRGEGFVPFESWSAIAEHLGARSC